MAAGVSNVELDLLRLIPNLYRKVRSLLVDYTVFIVNKRSVDYNNLIRVRLFLVREFKIIN